MVVIKDKGSRMRGLVEMKIAPKAEKHKVCGITQAPKFIFGLQRFLLLAGDASF
jgi:hypothetical protein